MIAKKLEKQLFLIIENYFNQKYDSPELLETLKAALPEKLDEETSIVLKKLLKIFF